MSIQHRLGKMARGIKQLVCGQDCSCHGNGDASLSSLHALKHKTLWAREGMLMKGASGFILASSVQVPPGSSFTVSILISYPVGIPIIGTTVIQTKLSIVFISLLNVVSYKFPLERHAHCVS